MSKDKQIDEMAKLICQYPQCIHYNIIDGCANAQCQTVDIAEHLYRAGYRKASEVALETVDDFQQKLRHIFLDMCGGNDYNTLNLLQIDSAIEALFDSYIAELKKKYTEGGE